MVHGEGDSATCAASARLAVAAPGKWHLPSVLSLVSTGAPLPTFPSPAWNLALILVLPREEKHITYSVLGTSSASIAMSEASSSNTQATGSSKLAQPKSDDIERLLNREATAFQREIEVERILKAFKLKCASLLAITRYALALTL